jgi:serine/threonine protein phosphatase 1
MARTFVIGDIHGESEALDRLMMRIPELQHDDTLIFIGDYLDRGADARGVVERVRLIQRFSPAKVVALRGNHEDKWIQCYDDPDLGFLLPVGNGCGSTYRSYIRGAALKPGEAVMGDEFVKMLDVKSWLPRDDWEWMKTLELWYEDEHAIYVHACLPASPDGWKHPRDASPTPLMWGREPGFFKRYAGKRVVFGHTPVTDLPELPDDEPTRGFADKRQAWVRGDLVGIDTGSGKGGVLSALELPACRIYDSAV